jgi:hypothetical protein
VKKRAAPRDPPGSSGPPRCRGEIVGVGADERSSYLIVTTKARPGSQPPRQALPVPTSKRRHYERALVYLAASVGLMLLGPGRYAFVAMLFKRRDGLVEEKKE